MNAVQLGAIVVIAALGGGAVGVAVAMSACAIANDAFAAIAALRARRLGSSRARGPVMAFLRRALPLGLVSIMSSVYFTVDLVLLGWLVSGSELGSYAAATKVLSLLVVVPGMLMSAALPAVASSVPDPQALRALAIRLLHWLAAVGLPVCVGAAIFARPLVRVAFGPGYGAAVPLVQDPLAGGGDHPPHQPAWHPPHRALDRPPDAPPECRRDRVQRGRKRRFSRRATA